MLEQKEDKEGVRKKTTIKKNIITCKIYVEMGRRPTKGGREKRREGMNRVK